MFSIEKIEFDAVSGVWNAEIIMDDGEVIEFTSRTEYEAEMRVEFVLNAYDVPFQIDE